MLTLDTPARVAHGSARPTDRPEPGTEDERLIPIEWPEPAPDPCVEPRRRLDAGWAVVLVVGWVATWEITMALAPAADADTGFHWLQAVSLATFFSLVATVVVAAIRRPAASAMGLCTGLLGLFAGLACGATGHVSATSAAFVVPLLLFGAMTALSSTARTAGPRG